MKNLDELLQNGRKVRDQIELLNEQLKELEGEKKEIDLEIMQLMVEQGIQRTGNDFANVSIGEKEIVSTEDWDSTTQWMVEHDALHLFQRRLSSTAVLEYIKNGENIPGIKVFTEPTLSFRRK